MAKSIAILGATGSVGVQAQDVARKRGYRVDLISAKENVRDTELCAREFLPKFVAMADENAAESLRIRLADTSVKVVSGEDGLCEAIRETKCDTVVNAILGKAGLMPSIATLETGCRLALANKESLVVAGKIVMSLAKEQGAEIIPVDSEHSAIFQSLSAGRRSEIKKLILTASGGPFFGKTKKELQSVRAKDALAHPTWQMGAKITVDSATLMNKGFEVIEAAHLFGVSADRVEVIVHRESMIHSMVEYIDHSIIAQMSVPDMRHCVQYALTHPRRLPAGDTLPQADLFALGKLTFGRPDTEVFPLLALARDCITKGGALPCVLNAANEVIVAAFLSDRIRFCEISELVSRVVEDLSYTAARHTYDQLMEADSIAREAAESLISR